VGVILDGPDAKAVFNDRFSVDHNSRYNFRKTKHASGRMDINSALCTFQKDIRYF